MIGRVQAFEARKLERHRCLGSLRLPAATIGCLWAALTEHFSFHGFYFRPYISNDDRGQYTLYVMQPHSSTGMDGVTDLNEKDAEAILAFCAGWLACNALRKERKR